MYVLYYVVGLVCMYYVDPKGLTVWNLSPALLPIEVGANTYWVHTTPCNVGKRT